jgi:hypothetical protein
MVVIHLKKNIENYNIPPMGPIIHVRYNLDKLQENSINMLNFYLERITIFESFNEYISISEYIDIHDYINEYIENYDKNNDKNIIEDTKKRLNHLLEKCVFINDIPEPIEIGDGKYVTLYYNIKRSCARECISDILFYLELNVIHENNEKFNNYIKMYLKYIIDNEIFSKEDLFRYTILENYI